MSPSLGNLSAPPHLLVRPQDAFALLVLAHGAGAGMRHAFMEALAQALAREGVATYRWEFPYMAAGRRRPDRKAVAVSAVREAIRHAGSMAPDLPLFAGGKSFGGRMTSTALAEAAEAAGATTWKEVQGAVFFGFPLHPPRKPGTERAEHLSRVREPMLFLQGDRDRLAELALLEPVVTELQGRDGGAVDLHVVAGADHSFHVLKRSGRTDDEVLEELARTAAVWMRRWAEAGAGS